ncbi:hypothetical protein F4802DRAFT_469901 [Xylaria palmicola]|nr:hypothetical protein F4802DRAFT_469901 [Xylaria palmicola]
MSRVTAPLFAVAISSLLRTPVPSAPFGGKTCTKDDGNQAGGQEDRMFLLGCNPRGFLRRTSTFVQRSEICDHLEQPVTGFCHHSSGINGNIAT